MSNDSINGNINRRFRYRILLNVEMSDATLKTAPDGPAGREGRGEPHHVAIVVGGHGSGPEGQRQRVRGGPEHFDLGELLGNPAG
jgi:hypothetical protein